MQIESILHTAGGTPVSFLTSAQSRAFTGILTTALLTLTGAQIASAVTIQWTDVADSGNAGELQATGTYGSVGAAFRIGTVEVTNSQYTEFLNATAATDAHSLYNSPLMGLSGLQGGITRAGTSGSFTYATIPGREDMPVNWVSVYDAFRFSNWMHNGQGSGDTETGAYALGGINPPGVTRDPSATIFLPSENEWYKAAYYDSLSMSYLDFPSATDTHIVCNSPGALANTANCNSAVGDVTAVGSYSGSASPYGTFDQGGNVMELTDTLASDGSSYVTRGGSWTAIAAVLGAAERSDVAPDSEFSLRGFRLAAVPAGGSGGSVPEPGPGLLIALGLLGLVYAGSRGN